MALNKSTLKARGEKEAMGPKWETHPCAERAPGAGQLEEPSSTLEPMGPLLPLLPKAIICSFGCTHSVYSLDEAFYRLANERSPVRGQTGAMGDAGFAVEAKYKIKHYYK